MTDEREYERGDRVIHQRHGAGTIVDRRGVSVCVVFDSPDWPHFGQRVWTRFDQVAFAEEAEDIQ